MRNEAELRLAIRDLYRGDGGTLNELDQGWNEGVDAAAEVFSAEIERLRAALRDFDYALYGRGTEDLRELHADALRDAGVGE